MKKECLSFGVSDTINFESAIDALKKLFLNGEVSKDVIKLNYEDGLVFIFNYGVTVFWGISLTKAYELLNALAPSYQSPINPWVPDELCYEQVGPFSIHNDHLCLPETSLELKLSLSYAISQSLKLGTFEESVETTIVNTQFIPKALSKKGSIRMG